MQNNGLHCSAYCKKIEQISSAESQLRFHISDAEYTTRGGIMIEFSELRGPNKIFGSFCKINEPNILFGPLISETSIVTPPLVVSETSWRK